MDLSYSADFYFGRKILTIFSCSIVFSQYLSHSVVLVSVQEAAHDVIKGCTVQEEPVGRWDIYSTTRVSPALFAVRVHQIIKAIIVQLIYFIKGVFQKISCMSNMNLYLI